MDQLFHAVFPFIGTELSVKHGHSVLADTGGKREKCIGGIDIDRDGIKGMSAHISDEGVELIFAREG